MLAKSLRGQLYKAPASKGILASIIVTEFSSEDGTDPKMGPSLGGLLFSLCSIFFFFFFFFVPAFPLDRNNSELKILRWVVAPSLNWGHVYLLEVVSSGTISSFLGILVNIISVGSWELLTSFVYRTF